MGKFFVVVTLIAGAVIAGVVLSVAGSADDSTEVTADAVWDSSALSLDHSGYARAIEPYDWRFPDDYGPHPEFQTEWWYYTGNLAADDGRRFGYQFTVFRRAIAPSEPESNSEWRSNQVYMAHLTLTDVEADRFHQAQRLSRPGPDLAGAAADPVYRVWLQDWRVEALNEDATRTAITAATDGFALDLVLDQVKPPALQGDGGLSPKSGEPGNASYYYSLSRLVTEGTITVGGADYAVSGASWMDHEFSTSALGHNAQGWDWFGLHLDDNRELMLGQIRLIEGGVEPVFGGLLIQPDGSTRKLASEDLTITATETWTSPHTGAPYPAGWQIMIDIGEPEPLDLTLTPLLADQELTEGGMVYWEGAVRITGGATGYGYAELTGYSGTMRSRF
ncbi:MAG: carotenoid 1,2-hydratase [Chloroflexi bacterium]|nr:carotenoid 1,2-hydratase [Chloroflexota bacterium]